MVDARRILTAYAATPLVALALIGVVLFGFQVWINNVQTLPSDFFPSKAVGSVAGLGGIGVGSIIFTLATVRLSPQAPISGELQLHLAVRTQPRVLQQCARLNATPARRLSNQRHRLDIVGSPVHAAIQRSRCRSTTPGHHRRSLRQ
ncbi:MAG: hypothetical protein MSG64_04155 [Pyrinomonadaceae bacterium MAG19_C2-C3]|nr:hypothetical protein [Pyrinomonadaceae bacterium MAG19_C2-C3]